MAGNVRIYERKELDPEWKGKLTECLKAIGFMDDIPFGQITLNVADRRIVDAVKQVKLK